MQSVLWILVTGGAMALAGALAGRDAIHAARNRTLWERAYWAAAGCAALVQTELSARFDAAQDSRTRAAHWRTLDREFATWSPPDTSCRVHVVAAGMRIDVNAADSVTLRRAFAAIGHSSEADALTDALLDWRDADDDPRSDGAERQWYEALGAMRPRNGPVAHTDELRRVRGFADITDVGLVLSAEPGRVAINSAPYPVLLALPGFGLEAANHVLSLREQGRTVTNLLDLAAGLPVDARTQLLSEFAALARVATVDPDAWIATTTAHAGSMQAVIELRLVLGVNRPVAVRRRIW